MVERGTAGCVPVRTTAAGEWFRPADGGSGSLLRLPPGVPAEAVRRVRDAGVKGLLPIGNVVAAADGVWLRTPQAPGPLLADLLDLQAGSGDAGFGPGDALAVATALCRVLRALHARRLAHGALDPTSVLLDPAGVPVVVLVDPGRDTRADRVAAAGLVRLVATAWCGGPLAVELAALADLVVDEGPGAALAALPRPPARPGRARLAAARAWDAAGRELPRSR